MKLTLLISILTGLAVTAADPKPDQQPRKACGECPPGDICLDRRAVVSPLPKVLTPKQEVRVWVLHKSPFERISFKAEVAQIENADKAVFEKLFKQVAGILLTIPVVSGVPINILKTDPAKGVPPLPPPPVVKISNAELDLLVQMLEEEDKAIEDKIKAIEKVFRDEKDGLKKFVDTPHEDTCDGGSFKIELGRHVEAVKAVAGVTLPEASASKLLADRIAHFIKVQPGSVLRLLPSDLVRINTVIDRQTRLESAVAELRKSRDYFADANKVLDRVVASEKTWFEVSQTYTSPADRKAVVSISAHPYDGGDEEKLTTLTFSWPASARFAISLGMGISSVAKQSFFTETVRDPNRSLTAADVFSYRVNGNITRPILFPATLIHIRQAESKQRKVGFYWAAGAGVNPGGDSPTGEILFGGSIRIGNVFISPVAHLGRQTQLSDGYELLEASPKPGDFQPPTLLKWKTGVAFAVTYRLPF